MFFRSGELEFTVMPVELFAVDSDQPSSLPRTLQRFAAKNFFDCKAFSDVEVFR